MKFASYVFSIAALSAATVNASPITGQPNLVNDLLNQSTGLLGNGGLLCNILSNLGLCDFAAGLFIPYGTDGTTSGQPQTIPISYGSSAPEGYSPVTAGNYNQNLINLLLNQNTGLLGNHGLVCNILSNLGLCDYDSGTYIPLYQAPGQSGYVAGSYTQFPGGSGSYNAPSGSGPSDNYSDNSGDYSDNSGDDSGDNYGGNSGSAPSVPSGGSSYSQFPDNFTLVSQHDTSLISEILGQGGLLSNSGLVCNILSNLGLCTLENNGGYVQVYHDATQGGYVYSLPFKN